MKLLQNTLLVAILCLIVTPVYAQDSEYNLDETFSVQKNGTIHLNSDDAEVSIKGTDRSDVHLVVYRRVDVDGWNVNTDGTFDVEVENRGGDLYIREDDNEKFQFTVGSIDKEYRITIEAPHDVALELKGDDDRYEISDVNGGVRLKADDSEVELERIKGEEFDFDIDDGSIRMDDGQGRLKLNMDDGEFVVKNGKFSEITADFDDGEMDVTTTLANSGSYKFDMDDGELEFNSAGGGGEFDISYDKRNVHVGSAFKELSSKEGRSVYRLSGGEARIDIDMDDGEVELDTI